jgi:coenzyme F420 hydrogenase subunit beta
MSENMKGIRKLFEEVIDRGLCTGCGACVTGCPYMALHEGRIVLLDKCTVEEGECYKYCPRTYTDMNALGEKGMGDPFGAEAIGATQEIGLMRSTDKEMIARGQDGGTVTTLLALALEERIIEAVVSTKMDEDKVARGYVARSREELLQCGGVSYAASYMMEAFKGVGKEDQARLGIVGVGCQMEALAKMRQDPPKNRVGIGQVKLRIGLFCGWALSPTSFHPYLRENYNLPEIVKFDIPHHPSDSFDVYTSSDKRSVPLDQIRKYINPACQYCWDMTAEFTDISVGAAGSAFPGWNTVIVRSQAGSELLELAESKGILETKGLPEERLNHLKGAALKRKKRAIKNIVERTGSKKDLLYMGGIPERLVDRFLKD